MCIHCASRYISKFGQSRLKEGQRYILNTPHGPARMDVLSSIILHERDFEDTAWKHTDEGNLIKKTRIAITPLW